MTGIFYGSTTGTTETLANDIAAALGIADADIHDVAGASAGDVEKYDMILLGSSTWGYGELQDDWMDFVEQLKGAALSGKKVALFGAGDCDSYPDTFCDAIGIIRDELADTGAQFVGEYDAEGYSVTDSRAFKDGKALGLVVDDNNESGQTASRMQRWIDALK